MNQYILDFKTWYELRITREKILVLALSWVLLYAIFSLFLFIPLDGKKTTLFTTNKNLSDQINAWNIQIDAVNKISKSSLYKQWSKEQEISKHLQGQYKQISQSSFSEQWSDVIRAILAEQSRVTIAQIKNLPEVIYNPTDEPSSKSRLYEQPFQITVYSNFYDTISYLQRLEEVLPDLHWESLHYTVVKYPIAKVEVEFAIIYEKTN